MPFIELASLRGRYQMPVDKIAVAVAVEGNGRPRLRITIGSGIAQQIGWAAGETMIVPQWGVDEDLGLLKLKRTALGLKAMGTSDKGSLSVTTSTMPGGAILEAHAREIVSPILANRQEIMLPLPAWFYTTDELRKAAAANLASNRIAGRNKR